MSPRWCFHWRHSTVSLQRLEISSCHRDTRRNFHQLSKTTTHTHCKQTNETVEFKIDLIWIFCLSVSVPYLLLCPPTPAVSLSICPSPVNKNHFFLPVIISLFFSLTFIPVSLELWLIVQTNADVSTLKLIRSNFSCLFILFLLSSAFVKTSEPCWLTLNFQAWLETQSSVEGAF